VYVVALATVAATSAFFGLRHNALSMPEIIASFGVTNYIAIPLAFVVFTDGQKRWLPRALALVGVVMAAAFVLAWSYDEELAKTMRRSRLGLLWSGVSLGFVVVAARVGRVDLRHWAFGLGDVRWWTPRVGLILILLAVGVPLFGVMVPELIEFYPRYKPARRGDLSALLAFQLGIGVAMFSWEWFCRGFLLVGLKRHLGATAAILIQAFPFFLLHAKKPEAEMITSWFGGLFMGWLALRSKSVWPAAAIHWMLYSWMEIVGFMWRAAGWHK
jgi:membrane protease YdiL (CAAX protease family)